MTKLNAMLNALIWSIDSLSTQVVSAAKLPILNPIEFDLWKMRIKHYFLMIVYSLWEVIINEDSVQPTTLLSVDQKLARRNELKAHGTLLMALPDKHQLKFNSHKDAKTLMEAIEKRFGGNTENKKVQKTLLKQLFENYTGSSSENLDQIHDRLLPSEWKTHTLIWRNKVNLEEHSLDDFATDLVSAATSVFVVCAQLLVSSHPNIDSLSNAVIFLFFSSQSTSPQLDNEYLKQIDVDDYEEMDLRWQMAMLTMRARRFLRKTRRNLGDNKVTTMGFDMSKVECYNFHRKGNFARECRSSKDTRRTGVAEPQRRHAPVETSTSNALVSQCDGIESYNWSYQAEEEPANFALMAITSSSSSNNEVQSCSKACLKAYDQLHSQQNESILQENINMLKNEVEASDNVVVILKQKLNQAEKERDDLKLKFDKFQTSLKSLTELLANQTNSKHGLGYYSESDYESNFMPPKPDLVFHTALIAVETAHSAFTVQLSPTKPAQDMSHTTRPMTFEHVKPSRHSVQPVETPILADTPKPISPKTYCSSKGKNRKTCFVCRSVDHLIKDCHFHAKPKTPPTQRNYAHRGYNKQHALFTKKHPQKHIVPAAVLTKSKPISVTAARPVSADVPNIMGNPQYALKDKGVIDSGCSRHMTGNMSYLSDFQELNGGYVAFSGNPKGGNISGKGKIKIATKDETSPILNTFIIGLENQLSLKGIKREFSVPRTPQQNGIAERKNMTLIEAARTMLADSILPIPFWAETVNTACYVQNRVLVTKPQNKTPYELLHGTGPTWLFNIDSLTRTMNYQPVIARNQSNLSAGFQEEFDAKKAKEEANQQYMLFPVWSTGSSNPQNKEGDAAFDGKEHDTEKPKSAINLSLRSSALSGEQDDMTKKKDKGKILNDISAAGPIVPTAGQNYSSNTNPISADGPLNSATSPTHGQSLLRDASQPHDMLEREDIAYSNHENVGAEADFNNLETSISVSPIPTTITHKDHPVAQIIGDMSSTTQTRSMTRVIRDQDVKSAFLYGTIEEEVYVCQPLGFEDPDHLEKIYKVVKALYGLHQAPRACQDKYVAEILKKFWLTEGKSASTLIDIEKPLLKDPDGEDIDVHIYSKSDASEGFDQIIDFLNGSYIAYALTMNPTIYASCIKQFWNTVAIKQSNDVTRLQAPVNKKKVMVTEAAIHLDDAEGVNCLPNEEIFTALDRMGYEKPSTKLTFYKAFFSSQWKFLIHTIL
uniref:Integrase catalytic domain-containing protein n=1 Tax=Tanacetum cinerariifolium TaxID=118510 RepID=A0A6L2K1L3_TANCI|nr:hypothetical protein [Tanacetum cinerariifolium]